MTWYAEYITPTDSFGEIAPIFKKNFTCGKKIVKATLYITAIGVYEARINGSRVGDFIMAPGWTVYNKRLQYQQYDITPYIKEDNTFTVTVGKGWYRSRLAGWLRPVDEGSSLPPAVIAQIEIAYSDGTRETVATDNTWTAARSPILFCDIYDGVVYDATSTEENTDLPVKVFPLDKGNLIPQQGEKVIEQERLKPFRYIVTPKGERVIDFGQNLTGYIEFTVNAKAGDRVSISHAEILDKDGNFYNENYRSAKAKIEYICRDGKQTFKPTLTFFGFQYIRLDEFPGEVNPDDFTAIAVYSDMKKTGTLASSNSMLNRLFSNIFWGQKGNFLDIPTDCPQRDERLGWTGDAQVFVRTASYNYDVEKFFTKWLADLAAEQGEDGHVPHVIPNVLPDDSDVGTVSVKRSSAAWGDAAVICPWQIYLTYGDKTILENQYDSMCRWIDYITNNTKDAYLWTGGKHYGDWLALDGDIKSRRGASNEDFIASVYYAYSTSLVAKAGKVLGRDVTEYEKLYKKIVMQIRKAFPTYKTQTEHVLALYFDIAEDKKAVADSLAQMIRDNDYHLSTGFVGTPYLLHALSDNGYSDIAYSLLLQDTFPSWLFSVKMGATTVWEHWDGIREDGSVWDSMMNSYNHYAYGAVADWVYGVAAGIQTVENAPGFEKIVFAPTPDDRLDWLYASIETRFGTASSRWYRFEGKLRYEIVTPSPATVHIDGKTYHVERGTYIF